MRDWLLSIRDEADADLDYRESSRSKWTRGKPILVLILSYRAQRRTGSKSTGLQHHLMTEAPAEGPLHAMGGYMNGIRQ